MVSLSTTTNGKRNGVASSSQHEESIDATAGMLLLRAHNAVSKKGNAYTHFELLRVKAGTFFPQDLLSMPELIRKAASRIAHEGNVDDETKEALLELSEQLSSLRVEKTDVSDSDEDFTGEVGF